MARQRRNRQLSKADKSDGRAIPQSALPRTSAFRVLIVLGACLAALVSYRFWARRTRDNAVISSSSSSANSPQRFAGGADDGYIDARICATCHKTIAASYSQTGMARAFYRAKPENMVEDFAKSNTYFHAASDEYYTMIRRGEKFCQRRHQLNPEHRETNVFEQQIDYVIGSGNHARTYLHLDSTGKLTELPLGWYAEKGGIWAMNPNYDKPRHMEFQREITFGCMFCHNGYPEMAPGEDAQGREPRFRGQIPEGIDCQRCHGPGREHVKAVSTGAGVEKIRAAILNPRRLDSERQLEICMQCHLQTTTRSLPANVVRLDRNIFSFRPSERLADYMLHFDYALGKGPEDRFEIAHTVYRLRKSACFLATAGTPEAITCTTCHNPHRALRGEEARAHYEAVCRQCHAANFNALVASSRHTRSNDCLGCHMPKRRTDDVVHAVMTDHYIQRRKPARDLLAPLAENQETDSTRYRGEVVLYYPARLSQTRENELYMAAAQVIESSNTEVGIPRLRQAIEESHPKEAGFYFHLAEAYRKSGKTEDALRMYKAAVDLSPKHRDAWLNYGVTLSSAGRTEEAAAVLELALRQLPDDPLLLSDLGEVYLGKAYADSGGPSKALNFSLRAVAADPTLVAAQQNLGLAYSATGNTESAVRAWEEAVRIQPDYTLAHNSLAVTFAERQQFSQAEAHYRLALRFDPAYVDAHFNYATLLAGQGKLDAAESELRHVIRLQPNFAMAYANLASVLEQKRNVSGAIEQYQLALRNDSTLDRAHLGLGMALASRGNFAAARQHFEQAARSADPVVRNTAEDSLRKLESLGRADRRH